MYSIEALEYLNSMAAAKAKKRKRQPRIAKHDHDVRVLKCPNFGTYRPDGWKLVETYFVDNTGFDHSGRALSVHDFLSTVKAGRGYAIIDSGEFQANIGEFIKLS